MKIINNICPYGYYMHTIQYNYIAINNTTPDIDYLMDNLVLCSAYSTTRTSSGDLIV